MRRISLAAALVIAIPAGAVAQSGGVEDCVAQGGARYETPSDATTHQYVGQDGLCAAADDEDTDVVITPVGGGKKPSTTPRVQPTRTAAAPVTPAPVSPAPEATRPETTPQTGPAPKPRPARRPGPKPAPTAETAGSDGRGAAATRSVTAALDTRESDAGLSAAGAAGSVPGGVLGALLAALGLAGAGVGLRRLNRH
ncbi:MAG: hypothetical protein U0237_20470 [Thermoleophilia bacterium]